MKERFTEEQIIQILKKQEPLSEQSMSVDATGSANRRFTSGRRSLEARKSQMLGS